MSSKIPLALEHFLRLSPSVWFHQPVSTTPSSAPDLILLSGWMDASPRNLAKYTVHYEKMYPSTRIVAITTTSVDSVFRTHAANQHRVQPVLEIIRSLPPNSKILIHVFSNGGAWTACLIAKQYRKTMGRPLPVTAMVLDSTPGRATYEATVRAFAVALPKNIILNMVGILILRILYGLHIFTNFIWQKPDLIAQLRADLNNKDYFDIDALRMYIYSEADEMVAWQFVEEHIEEARALGYSVDRDKFDYSPHCGHMLRDFERYWTRVEEVWQKVS